MIIGLIIVGCGFQSPAASGDASTADTPILDAAVDVPIDGDTNCFGTGLVQICVLAPLTVPITMGDKTIDTGDSGTSSMCVPYTSIPNGVQVCVIAGTMISFPGGKTFRVEGDRPLVLISSGNIAIAGGGTIDVASHIGGTVGAASNASQCIPGTPPAQGGGTGGGGYGGSFGGAGGSGGTGASGGAGGMAAMVSAIPTVLRGGCPGSPGANGGGGSGAGAAGAGGGAVLLIARGTIQIDGSINASGSAGGGCAKGTQAGAGGGGSGGMIALDASTVSVSGGGHIWANGGGGGEGAGINVDGDPGKDSSGPMNAGTGGAGSSAAGGNGGNGSVAGTLGGLNGLPGMNGGGGGGGGGGGAGMILIHAATVNGTGSTDNVAPPPVVTH